MKFKTDALRYAVETAIAEGRQQHVEYVAQTTERYATESAKFAARWNPEWEKALPKIRKALREDRPISMAEVPKNGSGSYHNVAVYDVKAPRNGDYEPHSDLRVVMNALDLIEETEVSDAQLQRLGVSSHVMRKLLELARLDATELKRRKDTADRSAGAVTTVTPPDKPAPRKRAPRKKPALIVDHTDGGTPIRMEIS